MASRGKQIERKEIAIFQIGLQCLLEIFFQNIISYLSILTIESSIGVKREATGEKDDGGGDEKDKGGEADHS